ncbi:hypothetical protein Q8A73_021501 [Channa argus]|nr:hypothetical protein Q8A73_021501 [Channa argus]
MLRAEEPCQRFMPEKWHVAVVSSAVVNAGRLTGHLGALITDRPAKSLCGRGEDASGPVDKALVSCWTDRHRIEVLDAKQCGSPSCSPLMVSMVSDLRPAPSSPCALRRSTHPAHQRDSPAAPPAHSDHADLKLVSESKPVDQPARVVVLTPHPERGILPGIMEERKD